MLLLRRSNIYKINFTYYYNFNKCFFKTNLPQVLINTHCYYTYMYFIVHYI